MTTDNGGVQPVGAAEAEKAAAKSYFNSFLGAVPEDERDNVDVLVVASDTQYFQRREAQLSHYSRP